jgi:hypothetical protein
VRLKTRRIEVSVLSYLERKASDAVLGSEKESINKSIATLGGRLRDSFGEMLKSQLRFGSSTRGTILPRSMDEHSDIDYMIVFEDDGSVPQTYLDRLKRFAETYYGRSEIYQSSPTIVLELNHIKFDLVPAKKAWFSGYKIPNGDGGWMDTDPNDFNTKLEEKNKGNSSLIKPTVRLAKFWNAQNGYVYDSFSFEKLIVDIWFWNCTNQKQYFFAVIDNLPVNGGAAQWRSDKITRAKNIVAQVKEYELKGMPASAEQEIKKLIPE